MKKIANINVTAFLKEVSEMDADCIGWYIKLILHEFDKGSLPNNTEKLAALCGVNYSNYPRFQRVYLRYIRDKFTTDDKQRIVHADLSKFMEAKEHHMGKRVVAGKKSYLVKFLKRVYKIEDDLIVHIKEVINFEEIDLKDEEELKKEIDSILNNKKLIFLNKKKTEVRVKNKKIKISKIQDLEFRNRVITFFDQESSVLRTRASKYMDQLEEYEQFFKETIAYMDYVEITGNNVLSWRRYKESWMKRNWSEKIIKLNRLEDVLKKVD